MAISLVAATTPQQKTDGTNITLTLPSLAADDYVFVFPAVAGDTPLTMNTSGYTEIFTIPGPNSSNSLAGYYKKMGGSPDTTAVVNGSGVDGVGAAAIAFCLRGVHLTTPLDASATEATNTSGSPNCPSITTVTNNAWVLPIACKDVSDTIITFPASPITYVNTTTLNSNASLSDVTVAGCTGEVTTAGAHDPGGYAGWTGGFEWLAASVAVRPAAGPVEAVASAAGTGASNVLSTTDAVASASGTGGATGQAQYTSASVGSAAGVGAADGTTTNGSPASASGVGAASATGSSTAASVGVASGLGEALGEGTSPQTIAAVGFASGSGLAEAISSPLASWPNINEFDLVNSFSGKFEGNFVEFKPDVGPQLVHRRYSEVGQLFSITNYLTGAEWELLLTFYRTTTENGTFQFNRTHPITRELAVFYFMNAPVAAAVSHNLYMVTSNLRLAPS